MLIYVFVIVTFLNYDFNLKTLKVVENRFEKCSKQGKTGFYRFSNKLTSRLVNFWSGSSLVGGWFIF